jgi:hypothetical protein
MSTHSNDSSIPNRKKFYYQIRRNPEDKELEFDPPKGEESLRDALHYHFPEERDFKSRMQRAILEFCEAEGSPLVDSLSGKNHATSSTTSLARTLTRQSSGMSSRIGNNSRNGSRSRRKFNPTERSEIYANRNNVCAKHRKNKTKVSIPRPLHHLLPTFSQCDPDICEGNFQFAARRAAAREAHAKSMANVMPPFQNPANMATPMYNEFAPYRLDSSEQQLPLVQQQSYGFPSGSYAHLPTSASGSILQIPEHIISVPQLNDSVTRYYHGPPGVPSHGYNEIQDEPTRDTNDVYSNFFDPCMIPSNAHHRNVSLSEKPVARPRKGGTLAAFKKIFNRLF